MGDQSRWNQADSGRRFDHRRTGDSCLAETSPGPVEGFTLCLVDHVADEDIPLSASLTVVN
jgi:hypothetical protein